MLQIGDVIEGRFLLQEEIGHGGMGVVFSALDQESQQTVAVKLIKPHHSSAKQRFTREAELLAKLAHPGVVRHISHGETSAGELYLAMELLRGEDLATRVKRGRLPIDEAISLIAQIADALGAAHQQGVIHRDLKPQNVMLAGGRPVLLDFGIARQESSLEQEVTATGAIMGTPGYLAPEQAIRGAKGLDARADVFSLGCVFFECLTGRRPFIGENALAVLSKILLADPPRLRSLCPDASEELERLVQRMLAKEPSERPQNGAEVAHALLRLQQGHQSSSMIPVAKTTITEQEQSLLCIILIGSDEALVQAAQDLSTTRLDLASIQSIVTPYGGQAKALLDGSWLVLFAAPSAAIDLALQAARCALALKQRGRSLPVTLTMGRANLSSQSFVGEAIDRAVSLLQDKTEQQSRGVLIDELIAGFVASHFELDLQSYILLREREAPELTNLLPLIGRERELQTLLLTIEDCAEESVSRTILVSGVAGIGKSRLWRELLSRLHQRDTQPQLLWAQGDTMRTSTALGLVSSLLRRFAGITSGESPELQTRRLLNQLPASLADEQRELLLELAGLSPTTSADPQYKSEFRQRAFEAFLRSQLANGMVLLVVEDLHWADLASVAMFSEAAKSLIEEPFMLLFTGRLEVRKQFPALFMANTLTEVQLGEIPKKTAEKALQKLLPSASPAEISQLVAQSQGNAFFLEELCRSYRQGNTQGLPKTLLASVQVRLGALPLECRRLLRAASIFGETFWLSSAATLLGIDGRRGIEQPLSYLLNNEIIMRAPESRFKGEDEYAFRHAFFREAAYETLTKEDRALGHALAGGWLVRAGEPEPAVLAKHFELGAETEKAIHWYILAAQKNIDACQLEEACTLARQGISLGAKGEMLGELYKIEAEASFWRGEISFINRVGPDVLNLLPKNSASFYGAAAMILGAHYYGGNPPPESWLKELNQPLIPEIASAQLHAWAFVGWLMVTTGRYRLGVPFLEKLPEIDETTRQKYDPLTLGWLHHAKACHCYFIEGGIKAPKHHYEQATHYFKLAKDIRSEAHSKIQSAITYYLMGELQRANEMIESTIQDALKYKIPVVYHLAKRFQVVGYIVVGDLQKAQDSAEQLLEEWTKTDNEHQSNNLRASLARVLFLKGEFARSLEVATLALRTPSLYRKVQNHCLIARVHIGMNDKRAAQEALAASDAILEGTLTTAARIDYEIALDQIEVLLALDQTARARQTLTATHQRLQATAQELEPHERESFSRLPDNRRILELATQWGVE